MNVSTQRTPALSRHYTVPGVLTFVTIAVAIYIGRDFQGHWLVPYVVVALVAATTLISMHHGRRLGRLTEPVPAPPPGVIATERVERLKDEFVSVVSHELRTPLTSIRGALGLLAGDRVGELPDGARRLIDISVTNADRLVRLLDDILDIERMESGCITLSRQVYAASDLIDKAVQSMRPAAEQAGIAIEVEPCPATILADRNRMIQTLGNLIGNAIKFSEPSTRVRVSAMVVDDQVEFTVQDQGRGIPLAKVGSIFERFRQVDASDSRDKGGTGLGLAICKSIVRQHDGTIWCESELGRGSRFCFTVPQATYGGESHGLA